MPTTQSKTSQSSRSRVHDQRKVFKTVTVYSTCKVEEPEELMPPNVSTFGHEHTSMRRSSSLQSPVPRRNSARCPQGLDLFTPASNFPSRTLPPPGIRARNLDDDNSMEYKIGDRVMVRHFQESLNDWTDWQHGIVVERGAARGYLGTFASAYVARATCLTTGREYVSRYLPFLWEIWPMRLQLPHVKPEECRIRKQMISNIYSRVNSPRTMNGVSLDRIYAPARVMKWEHGESDKITLQFLAGPLIDEVHEVQVEDVLPFTKEALITCRQRGYFVVRPDGQLDSPFDFVDSRLCVDSLPHLLPL